MRLTRRKAKVLKDRVFHFRRVKDGYEQYEQPLVRRLLSGGTVPKATMGRTWNELVVPNIRDVPAHKMKDHPSRKHDSDLRPQTIVFPPQAIHSDTSGVRRRLRRPDHIAELKANRKARLS